MLSLLARTQGTPQPGTLTHGWTHKLGLSWAVDTPTQLLVGLEQGQGELTPAAKGGRGFCVNRAPWETASIGTGFPLSQATAVPQMRTTRAARGRGRQGSRKLSALRSRQAAKPPAVVPSLSSSDGRVPPREHVSSGRWLQVGGSVDPGR